MNGCILRSKTTERGGGEGYRDRSRGGGQEYVIGQSHEEEGGCTVVKEFLEEE